MALTADRDSGTTQTRPSAEQRKVLAGALVGTTIEWYDFFIYAQAAGLVFAPLFFAPLEQSSPGLASLVSLATIGISFLFRPIGAIVAGRFGDRIGRKRMLVVTLLTMGLATTGIGLLPTHASIGVAAPLALITLRILQGFSAGGEWGGAALMAVEHAPADRRGRFGAYPQVSVPLALLLATAVTLGLKAATSEESFLAWGWRIPFLMSLVMIAVGYVIRRTVEESPVFEELRERQARSSAPLIDLIRGHRRQVVLTALIFAGNNAVGYLQIAFFVSYGAAVGLSDEAVLLSTMAGAVGYAGFTMYGGALSDRIGRVRTFQLGYTMIIIWIVPLFALMQTGNALLFLAAVVLLTPGIGLTYGPMSAMYAEMFPASVRYSGASIGYSSGAIIGGAFAPMIAQALLDSTGNAIFIGVYVMALCAISFGAVSMVREPKGIDLTP
ncbi:MAG: MFS transporter [Micromonosporaceae bacterium]